MVDFDGFHVGKYASPMDPMGTTKIYFGGSASDTKRNPHHVALLPKPCWNDELSYV